MTLDALRFGANKTDMPKGKGLRNIVAGLASLAAVAGSNAAQGGVVCGDALIKRADLQVVEFPPEESSLRMGIQGPFKLELPPPLLRALAASLGGSAEAAQQMLDDGYLRAPRTLIEVMVNGYKVPGGDRFTSEGAITFGPDNSAKLPLVIRTERQYPHTLSGSEFPAEETRPQYIGFSFHAKPNAKAGATGAFSRLIPTLSPTPNGNNRFVTQEYIRKPAVYRFRHDPQQPGFSGKIGICLDDPTSGSAAEPIVPFPAKAPGLKAPTEN